LASSLASKATCFLVQSDPSIGLERGDREITEGGQRIDVLPIVSKLKVKVRARTDDPRASHGTHALSLTHLFPFGHQDVVQVHVERSEAILVANGHDQSATPELSLGPSARLSLSEVTHAWAW
jgi:hypothetical protein